MIRKRGESKLKDQKNPGPKNELRVIESLSILQNINPLVTGYHHSKKNGEIDSMGFDVTIFLRNGFAFVIQIKSSNKKLETHFKKYPHIPVIIVSSGLTDERIAELLNHLINEFGKNFFEKVIDENDVYPEYRRHKAPE